MEDLTVRDVLCDMGAEEAVVFDNPDFDAAIIGVTEDGRAVYDFDLMVRTMMRQDDISAEDAIEFIDYNTIRAIPYAGPNSPVIMTRVYENPEYEKLFGTEDKT